MCQRIKELRYFNMNLNKNSYYNFCFFLKSEKVETTIALVELSHKLVKWRRLKRKQKSSGYCFKFFLGKLC